MLQKTPTPLNSWSLVMLFPYLHTFETIFKIHTLLYRALSQTSVFLYANLSVPHGDSPHPHKK